MRCLRRTLQLRRTSVLLVRAPISTTVWSPRLGSINAAHGRNSTSKINPTVREPSCFAFQRARCASI